MENAKPPSYAQWESVYRRFAAEIAHLLELSLESAGVRTHALEHRAKSVASVNERLERPGKADVNSFSDLPDLAGVRVIVYFLEEVPRILEICRNLFVIEESSSRVMYSNSTDFGYQSAHVVIRLPEARTGLPEWEAFGNLRAEIQIRTVLQHAWAVVSHSLTYKQESSVPIPLRRRLNRTSALLEIADQEFTAVAQQHTELATEASNEADLDPDDWDAEIDITTIEAFIDRDSNLRMAVDLAVAAGFGMQRFDPEPVDVVRLCSESRITNISGLRHMLISTQSSWAAFFADLEPRDWIATPGFILELLLIRNLPSKFTVEWLVGNLRWNEMIASNVINAANA